MQQSIVFFSIVVIYVHVFNVVNSCPNVLYVDRISYVFYVFLKVKTNKKIFVSFSFFFFEQMSLKRLFKYKQTQIRHESIFDISKTKKRENLFWMNSCYWQLEGQLLDLPECVSSSRLNSSQRKEKEKKEKRKEKNTSTRTPSLLFD